MTKVFAMVTLLPRAGGAVAADLEPTGAFFTARRCVREDRGARRTDDDADPVARKAGRHAERYRGYRATGRRGGAARVLHAEPASRVRAITIPRARGFPSLARL
jgi:hypothetical protein